MNKKISLLGYVICLASNVAAMEMESEICWPVSHSHDSAVTSFFRPGAEQNSFYRELEQDSYAIDESNVPGQTILHKAASQGDLELLESLILQEAKIDEKNSEGFTALHEAVFSKNVEAVRLLLAAKAAVNEQNSNGTSPLHLAAQTINTDSVKALIEAKANVNIQSKYKSTPLDMAYASCNENKDEAIRLLEAAGAQKGQNISY